MNLRACLVVVLCLAPCAALAQPVRSTLRRDVERRLAVINSLRASPGVCTPLALIGNSGGAVLTRLSFERSTGRWVVEQAGAGPNPLAELVKAGGCEAQATDGGLAACVSSSREKATTVPAIATFDATANEQNVLLTRLETAGQVVPDVVPEAELRAELADVWRTTGAKVEVAAPSRAGAVDELSVTMTSEAPFGVGWRAVCGVENAVRTWRIEGLELKRLQHRDGEWVGSWTLRLTTFRYRPEDERSEGRVVAPVGPSLAPVAFDHTRSPLGARAAGGGTVRLRGGECRDPKALSPLNGEPLDSLTVAWVGDRCAAALDASGACRLVMPNSEIGGGLRVKSIGPQTITLVRFANQVDGKVRSEVVDWRVDTAARAPAGACPK